MEAPKPQDEKLASVPISILLFDSDRFRAVKRKVKDLKISGANRVRTDDENLPLAKTLAERLFIGFARTDEERAEITRAVYAGNDWLKEARQEPGADMAEIHTALLERYEGICEVIGIRSHPAITLAEQLIENKGLSVLTRRIVLSVLALQYEEYQSLETPETGVRDCA